MTARRVFPDLGAVAILVAGGVHLDLWLWHGYRHIPTIGTLFLLNAISAALIAVALMWPGGPLPELAGFGYAATTLAAFFLSAYHGLFGFIDTVHGTPQTVSGLAEGAAILLLGAALARDVIRTGDRGRLRAHRLPS